MTPSRLYRYAQNPGGAWYITEISATLHKAVMPTGLNPPHATGTLPMSGLSGYAEERPEWLTVLAQAAVLAGEAIETDHTLVVWFAAPDFGEHPVEFLTNRIVTYQPSLEFVYDFFDHPAFRGQLDGQIPDRAWDSFQREHYKETE